jgi:hypothetical protein
MKHTSIIVAVGLALTAALSAAPANALNGRSFVSPSGSDSNPCTLALPCRNLQAALFQTNPGGEIAVLGTAGYSGGATLTIDRAISIVNPGAFEAGISPPSGAIGIVINAGPTDAVSLRGLTIDGQGAGLTGIQFNTGKSLTIANCIVKNLTGHGINFNWGGTTSGNFNVSNTYVANNGGNGVNMQASSSITPKIVFNRVQSYNNAGAGFGFFGNGANGHVAYISIQDSIAAQNGTGVGIATSSAGAIARVRIERSALVNNQATGTSAGLFVSGGGRAFLLLSQVTLTGNSWGFNGGSPDTFYTFGDNIIWENPGGFEDTTIWTPIPKH